MRAFVVELYLSREDVGGADRLATSVRTALEAYRSRASEVRFVNAVFVPHDETCLLFLEAHSVADVEDVLLCLGVAADRIAEALTVGGSPLDAG